MGVRRIGRVLFATVVFPSRACLRRCVAVNIDNRSAAKFTLRPTSLRWTIVSVTAYAAVIGIYFVLPLNGRFGEAMLGTALFPHDAILNAGILEWGRKALGSSSLHLFEWTAGFPLHNTLANTENLLGWQPAFALLRWAGASVTFAYNALLIGSFFVSAIGARLLAKRFGASEEGAFLSGLIFAFVPFHLAHAIHLQTLAVCWVPFAIYFLDRYLSDGKLINLAGVALSFGVCFLSGLYIGFFLAIALPVYVLAAVATHRVTLQLGRLLGLAGTAVALCVALWPIVSHYVAYAKTNGYAHPADVLTRFSLELLGLVKVPPWQALWAGTGYPGVTPDEAAAFPGIVAVILVVAVFWSAREPAHRAATRLLIVMALVFFAFSLGPLLMFHENTPVPFARWIPLPGRIFEWFSALRWAMRAWLFSLIFLAVIAGIGFTNLTQHASPHRRAIDCMLVALLLFFEYRPLAWYSSLSVSIPEPLSLSDAYPFLATENDRGAIVELPAADPKGYRTPLMVTSVYGSAGHLRRVAAIHGQELPPVTATILEEAERLPAESAIMNLRGYGFSRVVLHRQWLPDNRIDNVIASLRAAGLPVVWESQESVVFSLSQ